MILPIAFFTLWLAAIYLAVLGITAMFRQRVAHHFLGRFAQTPQANFIEAGARLAVGLAFVAAAPLLSFPMAIRLIGAFLAFTALLMLLWPSWHRSLAARSVAMIAPYIRLIGAASLALSALLAAILCAGWNWLG